MIAQYLPLEHLVHQSDIIVRGNVTGIRCFPGKDNAMIFTDVELRVRDTYAGDRNGTVTVRMLGGVVGSRGMNIDGIPHFSMSEDVILFLRRIPGLPVYAPVGLAQGKFRVIDGGEMLERDLSGISFLGTQPEADQMPKYLPELVEAVQRISDGKREY
jgi:hypothetical protein